MTQHQICDHEASIIAEYKIDENYIQKKLKNRTGILQPKIQILKENPQKFIKDILTKELMDKFDKKLIDQ